MKKLNEKVSKFYLLILLLMPIISWAHPHIFIDYSADLVFDETGLLGVQTEWTFDEMFSWQILDENTNGDAIIDEVERKSIEKNAFSYLAESGYFAYFLEGNEQFEVSDVQEFIPRVENDKIVYSFFIPWKVEAGLEMKYLKFLFDDETYFCAVVPRKDSVKLVGIENLDVEISMLDRVSYQISFKKK